ncbi:hypothetical protein A2567_00580 [Candidatus Azambacteria bacterium RIFOXYD1_FULL_42_11]|uniref:Pup ligase/deamidase n=3 Tax=Patescibacteria group TaxID=1783273 RepID=A0A0G0XSR2_9BACT|nr:MAG: Pup ligase/deamidase [Candidatus Woesebacteria bacterium GW2011_GWA1_41_13b]OGD42128.1 MAG: hypothetical protein A2567_00580 [Candidatus Azambacteria bacterium RIFOXYD1_FULL_42_11]
MRDRIVSEEIEWLCSFRRGPECSWIEYAQSPYEAIHCVLRQKHAPHSSGDLYFLNGFRLYTDTGGHLETALPECTGPKEVLRFERWAERFVCWIAKEFGNIGEYIFHKKTSDDNLAFSRGCHENYQSDVMFGPLLTESEEILNSSQNPVIDKRINYLALFLITRQIFTGSGGIMLYSRINRGLDRYVISPRTHFINAVISGATTEAAGNKRAIINIRNQPLANNDKYWRNHFILGDANMSDIAIFLKLGVTSCILEMIEEGFYNENLCLYDITEAVSLLKRISRDLTLRNVGIRLADGVYYNVLEVQEKFFEDIKRYLECTSHGSEKLEILERYREVLTCLKTDDEKSYGQSDWKIKMSMIQRYMDGKSLPLNHRRIRALDLNYHSPDPEKGLYYILKNRTGSQIKSLVSESEISDADKFPPLSRAKLRVFVQKLYDELGLPYYVSWDQCVFRIGKIMESATFYEKTLWMPDPKAFWVSALNLEKNFDAIKYLNSLKPGAIIFP